MGIIEKIKIIEDFNLHIVKFSDYIIIHIYKISNTGSHLLLGSFKFKKQANMYYNRPFDDQYYNQIPINILNCLIVNNVTIKNGNDIQLSNSFLLDLL